MLKLGWYKHHKGGFYKVVGVAQYTEEFLFYGDGESDQYLVVYEDSQGITWARPFSMFCEQMKVGKNLIPRFTYVGEVLPTAVSV